MLVGGAWYLRAYVYTGNPVFPFFKSMFGGAGLEEVLAPIKRPLAVDVWNLLVAIVPLTLEPDRFDSFAHQFGPVFLLFLPALLLERPPRRVLGLAGLAYAFLMICMTQRQSMRFLLFARGADVGGHGLPGHPLARAWTTRAAPGDLASWSCSAWRPGSSSHGPRALRESCWDRRRSPQFSAGASRPFASAAGSREPPATARLIGQDHRGFYIPRGYTMELAHRRRTGLGSEPRIVARDRGDAQEARDTPT